MKDLVRGMEVNEDTGHMSKYKGKKYAFCSPVCKKRFDREPEKYVKE